MKKTYLILLFNFVAATLLCILCLGLFAKNFSSLNFAKFGSNKLNRTLPITGFCSQGFEDFDIAINQFLTDRGFDGAELSVIKDGKFLIKRGYGWSDKNKTKILSPDDFLRIASLTKIFTIIAIKKLIQANKISYDTPAINFLGITKDILDENINKINIANLLLHQGGWNTNQSLDPLFSLGLVTTKLNKESSNITPNDILRYVVENTKLDFIPGTNTQYSNIGFTILGRILEKATKTNYIQLINNLICKPENIKVELGPVKLSDKSPTEIEFYKSNDLNLNNDSISLKAADSTFGLITSAPFLCKILDKYWIDGDKKNSGEQRQLLQAGTLPGVMALARQRYSGASIVILINSRDNNNLELDNIALQQLIDNMSNKCGI